MKRILLFLTLIFSFPGFALGADIKINSTPIQIGDSLPSPYGCLSFRGFNSEIVALLGSGCPGKADGWVYAQLVGGKNTDFIFRWENETLFLRSIGLSEVDFYRRTE